MIKKRLKAIYIITALLSVFVSSLFSFVPVKAYSASANEFTVTSTLGERNSSTIEVIMTVNMVDYYSGYINFTLYNPYSAALSYYALNTKITNFGTTSIRCNIEQTKTFEVHLFYNSTTITNGLYNAGLISSNTFASASSYVGDHWRTMCDVKTYGSKSLTIDRPSATDTTDIENTVTSIDTNITEIESYLNSIQTNTSNEVTYLYRISSSLDKMFTFDLEPYEYSAFLLFDAYMNNAVYDNTLSLPRFDMSANTSMRWDFFIRLKKDETVYFVYYMNENTISTFSYAPNDSNTFNIQRNDPTITSQWHLYYDVITNTSSGTLYITPTNSSSYTICPVFLGNYSQMPNEIRKLIGRQSEESDKMDSIIDILSNGSSTTVNNLDNAADQLTQETNTVSTLTNTYDTQITEGTTNITNAINGIDLGGLAQAGVFVANVMQSLYNNMGDYQILVTIPLVVGILLLIINKPRLFEPSETQQTRDVFHIDPKTGKSTVYRTHRNTKVSRGKHGERTVHTQTWNDTDLWGV